MRRFVHALEYAGLRLGFGLLWLVPLRWQEPVSEAIGAICYYLFPVRRDVVRENLRIAFPDLPDDALKRLIGGVYRQSAKLMLETVALSRDARNGFRRGIDPEFERRDEFDRLANSGKGFILATGHIGNWERIGGWVAHQYRPLGVVYKPMHNRRSDTFLRSIRETSLKMHIFSTQLQGATAIIRWLRRGEILAILPDQDAGRRGAFLPFFGKEASTFLGIAEIAVKYRIPIFVGFCLRKRCGEYFIRTFDSIVPNPDAEPAAEARRIMLEFGGCLEQVIREYPEQYFWWHRRWKTRPKNRPAEAAEPQS